MRATSIAWIGTTELPKSSKNGVVLLQSVVRVIQHDTGPGRPPRKSSSSFARMRSPNDAVCVALDIPGEKPRRKASVKRRLRLWGHSLQRAFDMADRH